MEKRKRWTKAEMSMLEKTGYTDSASFYAGYAARDVEAEKEKRELIDLLIKIYPVCCQQWGINFHEKYEFKTLIEKHTGKPIEKVIK
jgi:hypothetical protein